MTITVELQVDKNGLPYYTALLKYGPITTIGEGYNKDQAYRNAWELCQERLEKNQKEVA